MIQIGRQKSLSDKDDKLSTATEFKRILNSIFFTLFILVMGTFLNDVLLYNRIGSFFFSFGYSIILCLYIIGWTIALWCGRTVVTICLITNFIMFCVFKEYYKENIDPLNLYAILSAFHEGVRAGIVNTTSLFDKSFWIMGVTTTAQIIWILYHPFYRLKLAIISLVGGGLVIGIMYVAGWLTYAEMSLYIFSHIHKAYENGLLYKVSFTVDSLREYPLKELDKIVLNGNGSIIQNYQTDDVKLSRLPAHIYMIQAEKLTTMAITEKVMPFLYHRIRQDNAHAWTDENHYHCLGSANTDFMMLSGLQIKCRKNRQIVYFKYRTDIYQKIKTLPERMREKGYHTLFLHGYERDFFNRGDHYPAMGFDKIVFMEDFPTRYKRGLWGVSDTDVLESALILNKKQPQTFTFIITVSMHPPYETTLPNKIYSDPADEKESYINAAAEFDAGLERFDKYLPNDSLVILYGDHNAPDVGALHTPLIMWYKGDKPFTFPDKKEVGFSKTIEYINSIFE